MTKKTFLVAKSGSFSKKLTSLEAPIKHWA